MTFGFARAGEGYFRPDGKAIIFQAVPNAPPSIFHTPKPNEDDYQIYTADLAPTPTPKMVSTGKGKCTCCYYHPDGKSILFASTHLDPAPGQARRRAEGPGLQPDRARTAGTSTRAMDIFKADLDGSNLVRLTDTPGYDAEGSYSPDGKQIIFTSFRDGDAEIYIMDADGKNPRRITHKPRATTAARSSRPTARRSSTGATARRTTCSRSTSTTPRGPPSGP